MKKFYITPAIDIADLDAEATLTPSSIPEGEQVEDTFDSKRAGSWDALDSWDTDDWSYSWDNDYNKSIFED